MFEAVFSRGTTVTHYYEIPCTKKEIKQVSVAYWQNNKVVLIKRDEECVVEDGVIAVTLSQEDTLLFKEGETLSQVKVSLISKEVQRTMEHRIKVLRIFDEEVFKV
jgi:hypothetical protein